MQTWQQLAEAGAFGKALHLKDRAVLFERGDPARSVYLLYRGAYEVYQESDEGSSVVVKLVTGLTMPGSVELVAGEPTYLESIRVAREATMYRVPARDYLAVLSSRPRASYEAMVDIGRCFAGAAKFEASRLHNADVLLAALVLAYADVFGRKVAAGVRVELKRSQAQLAASIGCTERSVNRLLTGWREQEVLVKLAGRYLLKDPDALRRIAGPLCGALVHRWEAPRHLAELK
ncbi:MAG: Crp/Fnr family transcriptional regulator [Archangiaceae bacterium]|nr:Crp/Fnr family transcriptional regulator [Archangiaceae bacterium]